MAYEYEVMQDYESKWEKVVRFVAHSLFAALLGFIAAVVVVFLDGKF